MKKDKLCLLSLFICSFSILIGFFIGRNTRSDYVTMPAAVEAITYQTEQSTDYRLDVNHATKSQLMELPGIGDVIAQRIVDYRSENGLFQAVDDLINIEGIGEKKLQSIVEYIKVGG